tara:strand:- start:330 stop:638 length:309 start_codon:yes stop_codon:yes gene_type:complete
MKILNVKPTEWYNVMGMQLNGSTYLDHKVDTKLIALLNDEFDSVCDMPYDIIMSICSEFGDDFHIEEWIKNIEAFYGRDLTMAEIESCIEAYNDYQEELVDG